MRSIVDRTVLDSLLTRTEMEDCNIYRADEVARWPRATHKRLLELGLLREIERATAIWCNQCLDDGECIVEPEIEVDPKTGEVRGYWLCHTGPVNFTADEFRRYEFQLCRLAQMVAEALGTQGTVTEVVPQRVYLLGVLPTGGGPLELFLAGGVRLPDAQEVLARAHRLHASPAPVLIVTEHLPKAYPWRDFRPTMLVLSELAKWIEADLTIDFSALVNTVGTLRPPAQMDTRQPAPDAPVLTRTERDVLEALAGSPRESMLLVELMAAAGYGRHATCDALQRLRELGLVERPSGKQRKGDAITAAGREFLAPPPA